MFGNLNCFEVNGVAIKISPSLKNCTLQTELANAQRARNSHAEAALSKGTHDDIDSSQLASYHRLDILLRFSVEYLMTVGGGWGASTELHERQTQVLDIERLKKRTLHRKVFPGSLKMPPYCRIWQAASWWGSEQKCSGVGHWCDAAITRAPIKCKRIHRVTRVNFEVAWHCATGQGDMIPVKLMEVPSSGLLQVCRQKPVLLPRPPPPRRTVEGSAERRIRNPDPEEASACTGTMPLAKGIIEEHLGRIRQPYGRGCGFLLAQPNKFTKECIKVLNSRLIPSKVDGHLKYISCNHLCSDFIDSPGFPCSTTVTNERKVDHPGPKDNAVSLFNTGTPVNTTPETRVSRRLIVSLSPRSKLASGWVHLSPLPLQYLQYLMQTVCVCWGALAATDECLIISTPAVHSKKSIIKAWGIFQFDAQQAEPEIKGSYVSSTQTSLPEQASVQESLRKCLRKRLNRDRLDLQLVVPPPAHSLGAVEGAKLVSLFVRNVSGPL
ncbi:unnamed protein product [Leuciscus chuanchicus]